MPSRKGTGASVKTSAHSPDGLDLRECLDALHRDMGASAHVIVYQNLVGDVVVGVVVDYMLADKKVKTIMDERVFTPSTAPLLAVTVQLLHKAYHHIDRLQAKELKIPTKAPSVGE